MTPFLVAMVLSCDPGHTCEHASKEAASCEPKASTAAAPKAGAPLSRGEKLKGLEPVSLASVLASPDQYAGKTVAVEAQVRRACEQKGCWMELASAKDGPGMRVTFKGYGFFVPVDSAGRTAKVEGTVKVSELSAEQVAHLKAEGATVASREVQLIATGVELR